MFCAHCGAPCGENEVFCAHCGAALLVEGGRVAEGPSPSPAPAVENPAETPDAPPGASRRRFALPRLSRRGWLLLGGCAAALAVVLAALAGFERPAEGFQAGPAALTRIEGADGSEGEYFYSDGALVAGPEEELIGLQIFLDGKSCLAMDLYGYLTHVVTAGGAAELDLPEGTLTGYAASADGSALYYATAMDMLWRIPLPDGAPELAAEGCAVNELRVSPSGDAAVYYDLNTDHWYLVRQGGTPEELPLPVGVTIPAVSDGGRYVYYLVSSWSSSGTSAVLEVGGYLCCWDGTASHLVGYTESFHVLTNRTGDQLFLADSTASYVVDGVENRCFHGELYPTCLLQGQNLTSGTYYSNNVAVLNCDDLTEGYFASERRKTLYRLEGDVFRPVLEEVFPEQMRADATGEILWYAQNGGLWQFRDGKAALQWDDPGTNAYLYGVSPDGATVVYENGSGLWRLTAGGEPEQLSERVSFVYPCWKGFYYAQDTRCWYVPWDGEPEELEELNGVENFSVFSTMQTPDGSLWHVIDGMDPIPAGGG